MSGHSGRLPAENPPVAATYFIVFVALIVVLLPTLLHSCIGRVPVMQLPPAVEQSRPALGPPARAFDLPQLRGTQGPSAES